MAKRQGVGLREEVCHQFVMIGDGLSCDGQRVLRSTETDELGRDHVSVMKQLVKRMLTIGSRLAKVDSTSAT